MKSIFELCQVHFGFVHLIVIHKKNSEQHGLKNIFKIFSYNIDNENNI